MQKVLAITIAMGTGLLSACGSSSDNKVQTPQPQPQPTQPQPQPSEPAQKDYQTMIDNVVGDDVPGLILRVDGKNTDFLGAAGLSDIDSQAPMQVYHQMPAGSAGKKATALLVAMLHEASLLDIDGLISTWLPDNILNNIPYSDTITLRQLLNHTAGVYDYLDEETSSDWFTAGIASIGELKSDIDALEFVYGKPAYFAPGEGVKYSNSGYILAGLVMDQVLGEHHHRALREWVLEPLGLIDTYYSGFENELGSSIPGYIWEDGTRVNTKPFYESVGVADAPLVTTVSDLTALLRAILTDKTVVTEEMRDLLIGEDNIVATDFGFDFGLGLFKEETDAGIIYHHGGDEAGYKTSNAYVVNADVAVTLFANCNGDTACIDKTDSLFNQILVKVIKDSQ
ncbi:class A beta-lactamase-related serine hydrolase [Thalassotalea euphylliae]|uniref:Class A beta-lactamase-related serine hydrolase n=1 Tax=Thalassotalea euphylliae TaxID=1655234 RepID=A0A3E0TU45_9GAMM|nr:serine hydrolase domain-containing protein [Thalassotalea euphylliae]REL28196.1 class A beta-lactamase-related serine hydrolase [Thalassotalea euphylliae]